MSNLDQGKATPASIFQRAQRIDLASIGKETILGYKQWSLRFGVTSQLNRIFIQENIPPHRTSKIMRFNVIVVGATVLLLLAIADFVQCEVARKGNGNLGGDITKFRAQYEAARETMPHDEERLLDDDSEDEEFEEEDDFEDEEAGDEEWGGNSSEEDESDDEEGEQRHQDNDQEDDKSKEYQLPAPGGTAVVKDVAGSDLGVPQILFQDHYGAILEKIEETRYYFADFVNLDSSYLPVRDICKNKHENCAYWAALGGKDVTEKSVFVAFFVCWCSMKVANPQPLQLYQLSQRV